MDDVFWHKTIMTGFPHTNSIDARNEFGVLFRAEETKDGLYILVQSKFKPNWDVLVEKNILTSFEVKQWERPLFLEDEVFYFKIKAYPTKTVRGKKIELKTDAEQLEWIKNKFTNGGFDVKINSLVRERQTRANLNKNPATTRSGGCLYSGVITVLDPRLALDTYQKGIGRGRAFGYGLLSIKPKSE